MAMKSDRPYAACTMCWRAVPATDLNKDQMCKVCAAKAKHAKKLKEAKFNKEYCERRRASREKEYHSRRYCGHQSRKDHRIEARVSRLILAQDINPMSDTSWEHVCIWFTGRKSSPTGWTPEKRMRQGK